MEAEELIKKIKKFVEELDNNFESILIPTKYDPNDIQYDVSFIMMEKVEDDRSTPRFIVNVTDLNKDDNVKTKSGK